MNGPTGLTANWVKSGQGDPSSLAVAQCQSQAHKTIAYQPDDFTILIEMGLVEMLDDEPALTNEGHRAIDWN
jgi:hypothetical protein